MPWLVGTARELLFRASFSPDWSSDGPGTSHRVDCFIGRVVNRQSSWNVIDRVPVCNDLQILYRRILNSRGAALHLTNPDRDIQSPDWPLHDGADISQFVTQGIFPKLFPCARPKRPADGRKIDQHPGHDRRVQHVGACGNFSVTAKNECNRFINSNLAIIDPVGHAPDRIKRPHLEVRSRLRVFLEHCACEALIS